MPRRAVVQIALVALLVSGCGREPDAVSSGGSPPAAATGSSPAMTAAATVSTTVRLPLPSGFPALPGAISMPIPEDDQGVIASWSSDQLGSAAYDFYVAALPAAGYPIVGLYPGGGVALIRFRVPSGAVWQIVAHDGAPGTAAIEVRLDRP